MRNPDTIKSILELYDNKLPFAVAEYFCKIYLPNIVCNKAVTYKLFKDYVDYRNATTYKFTMITSNTESFNLVKLESMEIHIPKDMENEFMDKFSNAISTTYSMPVYDWYDDEPGNRHSKYSGKVTLTF